MDRENRRMCQLCSISRRRLLWGIAGVSAAAAFADRGTGDAGPRSSRIATVAMLTAIGAAAEAAESSAPVIRGAGQYRYQVVENWGELPPGYTYGDTAAVCVDSKDNIYVFTRGAHPIIVFDRNGKFLRSWGEDIGFTNAHGAAVGPDDMLYLTDDFGHAVRKCTTDGRVVLTIGTPKKPAPAFSGHPWLLALVNL